MEIREISALFGVAVAEYTQIATGHINLTFLVTSQNGKRFILQSLNREIFISPEAVMQNISAIEAAFSGEKKIAIPCFMRCNGRNYAEYCGVLWRMYPFVPDSESSEKAYLSGFSHGRFIKLLSRDGLCIMPTVRSFHDYGAYAAKMKAVCGKSDITDRLSDMEKKLEEVFADVPKRNIHGDAKSDNIIIGEPCTVIDLDTVMYSYAAIDYGDMIRSANAAEYDDITKGFADGLDGLLTEKEVDSLYYGILWVTAELAVRYMTDVYAEKMYFSGKTRSQCRERAESLVEQLKSFIEMKKFFVNTISRNFRK